MRSNSSSSGTLEYLFNELNERAESSFQVLKSHHRKIAELTQARVLLKEENRQLKGELAERIEALRSQEEEGALLAEANIRLTTELAELSRDKQRLEQRLKDVQLKVKSLAEGALLGSSDAIAALIRETLDPADWPDSTGSKISPEVSDPVLPDKFDAKAILNGWAKSYPKAFSGVTVQPLKTGIHEDLAAEGGLPDHWIRRALAGYVRSPRYLRVLKTGAVRMDLAGNNAGFVTEEDAQHAREQLEEIRQQRLEKDKAIREQEEKKRLNQKLSQLLTKKD